jgi:DNA polymerase-3 subunit epsilon
LYAIIDIETTGGKFNEEGITEIAIYKFDGHEIVDQFISLVNPEKAIQPFVVNLTGINNKMLINAPKFFEVAKRIVEITQDCIFVAHNTSFDYRILRTEFRRLGFEYERETLCTVELSKKLIPDMPSYSLGKLVRALGIPVTDRHRASGDALATVKLFKLLLNKDTEKTIITEALKTKPKHQLEPKLIEILDTLPNKTGVYYIHNKDGNIIYIGKSNNIKNRINQHFTGTTAKSKKIQINVSNVTFEITGSELVALLKESEEIKRIKPLYNRALRKRLFTTGLYHETDENGYINLSVDKADGRRRSITTFTNRQNGNTFVEKIVDEFNLCQKLTGLYNSKTSCFRYELDSCLGACVNEETTEDYNLRVNQFLKKYNYKNKNMVILDRGRDVDERSAILIENGEFKGLAFINLNYQITKIDILKTLITTMENNKDSQHIIQSYLRKNPKLKIITL